MKTGNNFRLLLRISLGLLLVSLGLFSAASADRTITAPPAAYSARQPAGQPQPAAVDTPRCAPDSAASASEPAAAAVLTLESAESAASCPSGTVLTCCKCGCDCRKSTISPQNFCLEVCPPF